MPRRASNLQTTEKGALYLRRYGEPSEVKIPLAWFPNLHAELRSGGQGDGRAEAVTDLGLGAAGGTVLGGCAGAHATEHDAEGEHRQRQEDDSAHDCAPFTEGSGSIQVRRGYVKGAECGTP